MKKPVFTGAAVAIITPFKSTGEVDYEEFGKIIDHQIAHGTDAIVVCGTTGEASALHDKEHREALAWCCEYVNHRVPVVAGTGSNDTAYAIELTKFAAECGADAGLSVTPYYNKTTQRGLIAHYTAIADCCDLPIVLYNVPSRTGVSFTADTLYELSKHPNINGLKAASGNFSLLAETMAKCGDNLNVWSGNDDQIVPMMSLGAKGVISVLSNVAPQETHDLTQLCLENRYPEAAQMQFKYHNLIDALFCEVNPIPVKKAMELLGGNIRRFVACREDIEAAENMLVGSLFAGIAFSFARLGNVHAMSHPISAYFDVPHGVANAVLLPVIAEYNALADHGRYFKIFNYISPFKVDAGEFEPGLLPGAIRELCGEIGIPNGIVEAVNNASRNGPVSREAIEEKIEAMAADAMKSGNIAVNPRASRQSDIEMLYRRAL